METKTTKAGDRTPNYAIQLRSLRELANYNRESAAEYDNAADWLEENGLKLDSFDYKTVGKWIEIRTPDRSLLLSVLRTFGGKWQKNVSSNHDGTLVYELNLGVVILQCVSAPPPPSCQIVEEWVDVPAKAATRELRKVVKCVPDVEQAVDEAVAMAEGK